MTNKLNAFVKKIGKILMQYKMQGYSGFRENHPAHVLTGNSRAIEKGDSRRISPAVTLYLKGTFIRYSGYLHHRS